MRHKLAKVGKSERFGEEVGRVEMARNPLEFENAAKSKVTNKFSSTQDVLGLLEGDGIEGEVDDAAVVGSPTSRAEERNLKVEEKIPEEDNLFSSDAHREVFGLRAGH